MFIDLLLISIDPINFYRRWRSVFLDFHRCSIDGVGVTQARPSYSWDSQFDGVGVPQARPS